MDLHAEPNAKRPHTESNSHPSHLPMGHGLDTLAKTAVSVNDTLSGFPRLPGNVGDFYQQPNSSQRSSHHQQQQYWQSNPAMSQPQDNPVMYILPSQDRAPHHDHAGSSGGSNGGGPVYVMQRPVTDFSMMMPSQPMSGHGHQMYGGAQPHASQGLSHPHQQQFFHQPSRAVENDIDDNELMGAGKRSRSRAVKIDEDTVKWLKANFEMKPGFSLPRSLVYKAYVAHMQTMMQEAANAAGFGKLIRTVFTSVTSRRLGSRGNSRYHYDGLRIKPSSAVAMMDLSEEQCGAFGLQTPGASRAKSGSFASSSDGSSQIGGKSQGGGSSGPPSDSALAMLRHSVDKKLKLPGMPSIVLGDDATQAEEFSKKYQKHCEELLEHVRGVSFVQVYNAIHQFWKTQAAGDVNTFLDSQTFCDTVKACDVILYDTMMHVLVPEILRPIGNNTSKALSTFAEDLHSCVSALRDAKEDLPDRFMAAKIGAVDVFLQIMKRRTDLNNLAQAALKMLQSESQVQQMRGDLARVDFAALLREAQWVTECPYDFAANVADQLKTLLDRPRNLSDLSHWLHHMASQALSASGVVLDVAQQAEEGQNVDAQVSHPKTQVAARKLMLAWSFYSSQMLRELTVKSAPSFGSFNALRLLLDEYLHYVLQTRVTHPLKLVTHPDVIVRTTTDSDQKSSLHCDDDRDDTFAAPSHQDNDAGADNGFGRSLSSPTSELHVSSSRMHHNNTSNGSGSSNMGMSSPPSHRQAHHTDDSHSDMDTSDISVHQQAASPTNNQAGSPFDDTPIQSVTLPPQLDSNWD